MLKLNQTALSLALTVVLARLLGVGGFGIYAFCISIVNLLTVPAMVGGQQLLVREIAVYKAKGEFHFLRGLLQHIRRASIAASFIIVFCAISIGLWIYQDNRMQLPFLIAMALVPLMVTMNLQSAVLRGLCHILLSQINLVLFPLLVILIVSCVVVLSDMRLGPEVVLVACDVSIGVLVVFLHFLICRLLPREVKSINPERETYRWTKSMLPFVFAGAMEILNKEASVIFLGVLQDAEAVGLFRVAQRGAELVPFGLLAVNMAIAPTVSELYAKGEMQRLQHIFSKGIKFIFVWALPMSLFLIFGGKWIIHIMFGDEYSSAYTALVILCIGYFFYASMGSVALVLNMAGFEKLNAYGVLMAAIVNAVFNFILIPVYGVMGSAIAASLSLIVLGGFPAICLHKTTGISVLSLLKTGDKRCCS